MCLLFVLFYFGYSVMLCVKKIKIKIVDNKKKKKKKKKKCCHIDGSRRCNCSNNTFFHFKIYI